MNNEISVLEKSLNWAISGEFPGWEVKITGPQSSGKFLILLADMSVPGAFWNLAEVEIMSSLSESDNMSHMINGLSSMVIEEIKKMRGDSDVQ